MVKIKIDKEDKILLLKIITILLGGIALTVTSFCIYYIVKPNSAIIAVICIVDFIYTLFSMCMACKLLEMQKWFLKGVAIAVGYVVAFICIGLLFLLGGDSVYSFSEWFLYVTLYAFFIGPCIYIVIAFACFALMYG